MEKKETEAKKVQEEGEIMVDSSEAKEVESEMETLGEEMVEGVGMETGESKEPDAIEIDEKTGEVLPFPEAPIVRIMKRHLDKDKMIKKEVKLAMNKWLGNLCASVTREMNKFPYVMMNINEFNEGKRVFEDLENFDKEKKRILAHFEAIKQDIAKLERDLGKKEEEFFK